MFILPYKNGSRSANDLAAALGAKQIKREGSKFKGSPDKIVINWGSTTMSSEVAKCEVINKPEAVVLASNKLSFFNAIHQYNRRISVVNRVTIPTYITDKDLARDHIDVGNTIVARTILNGHSGAGIVLCETREQLEAVNAPLYVVYVAKKQEYRVHVLRNEVVDVQRKARRVETPDDQVNWKIRNHDNGFIYSREGALDGLDPMVLSQSVKAVSICGLDFGAVDVIYNEKSRMPYVLEVNTAPGLSGETLAGYAKRLEELVLNKNKLAPKTKTVQVLADEWFNDKLPDMQGLVPPEAPMIRAEGNPRMAWGNPGVMRADDIAALVNAANPLLEQQRDRAREQFQQMMNEWVENNPLAPRPAR